MKDGLYMIRKNSHEYLPVYCDMTSEQGAYTLLVTSASNGWNKNEVKLKNPTRPSLSRDYSILGYADQIKALSGGKTFKYRLEAHKRGHWGGVWTVPIKYRYQFYEKAAGLRGLQNIRSNFSQYSPLL